MNILRNSSILLLFISLLSFSTITGQTPDHCSGEASACYFDYSSLSTCVQNKKLARSAAGGSFSPGEAEAQCYAEQEQSQSQSLPCHCNGQFDSSFGSDIGIGIPPHIPVIGGEPEVVPGEPGLPGDPDPNDPGPPPPLTDGSWWEWIWSYLA